MKDYPLTIPANDSVFIDVAMAERIYCDASNLSSFKIKLDNDDELNFFNGRKYQSQERFSRVQVINTNGSALVINLLIGNSDVTDQTTSLSGNVGIINAPAPDDEIQIKTKAGTKLEINDALAQTKLDAVETAVDDASLAITNLLKNDEDKRADLTTLDGASYVEASTTTTIVSAVANTNGIIIRRAQVLTSSGGGYLHTGATASNIVVGSPTVTTNWSGVFTVENVFVPAGVALEYVVASTNAILNMSYEVL